MTCLRLQAEIQGDPRRLDTKRPLAFWIGAAFKGALAGNRALLTAAFSQLLRLSVGLLSAAAIVDRLRRGDGDPVEVR
jgi:hypothetical protein